MNSLELINKSVYGTIGYISSIEDLHNLEKYIVYNLPILKEFSMVIVATNYKDYPNLSEENTALWTKYLPDCILLDSKINKGHNFGTAELDNMLFDFCKDSNMEWLCKSANDVILTDRVLSIELNDADFYYFNGIGFGGINHFYKSDLNRALQEDFFPQTNFYFINVSKCDYLNSKSHIDEIYQKTISNPNYNGNPYDYGFSACEEQLKHCVYRNNLVKCRLADDEKYMLLLNCIMQYQIHDPSHKNVMVNGVCHYHYPEADILEV
jgi:hypothetical protein